MALKFLPNTTKEANKSGTLAMKMDKMKMFQTKTKWIKTKTIRKGHICVSLTQSNLCDASNFHHQYCIDSKCNFNWY